MEELEFFVGSGLRATSEGLETNAAELGVSPTVLAAVVSVEASGKGFGERNLLKALFEPHKFYSELAGDPVKQKQAVKAKLAYPKWKPGNYPRTLMGVYDQIIQAMEIDQDAALRATSWGLGQIMGFNCNLAGYASAWDMVQHFLTGEDAQIEGMVRVIKAMRLDDELQRQDWAGFARGYNGSGYAENGYDTKLKTAFRTLSVTQPKSATSRPVEVSVARMGSKGMLVKEVQKHLVRTGFPVTQDGDFGPATKRAVTLFQLERDLPGTGSVDPATWELLQTAPDISLPESRTEATLSDINGESRIVRDASKVKQAGMIGSGAVGLLGAASETGLLDQVQEQAGKVSSILAVIGDNWWILAAAGFLVVAYYAHSILRERLEDHRTGRTL